MKQSRTISLLKSLMSTGVGFGVAYVANMLILPLFGLPISHSANLILTSIYTVISIARGFALERAFEAFGWRVKMSPFASAVLAERQRQQDVEGWSLAHDDEHARCELALAGAGYIDHAAHSDPAYAETGGGYLRYVNPIPPRDWPWSGEWWKPVGFRRDLVKGCALIIAEGDKFDRSRKSKRSNVTPLPSLAHKKSRSEYAGSSG